MKAATTNRDHVLSVATAAMQRLQLQADHPDALPPELRLAETSAEAAELAHALRRSLHWAKTEERALAQRGQLDDLQPDVPYISRDPVLSLVQSGINASPAPEAAVPAFAAHEAAAEPHTAALHDMPLRSVVAHVALSQKPRHPITGWTNLDDFRFDEPKETWTVAMMGDWGTASPGALKVADQIAALRPDHVIHLGDIYTTGTPAECQANFVDVWKPRKPENTRIWAMCGNHEMYSGGDGYYGLVLPFCNQPASYFNLGNRHWRLIAIDTGHTEYRVDAPQPEWIRHQLSEEGPRKIVLSHHQMFSAADERPVKFNMRGVLGPYAQQHTVHGWVMAHEHDAGVYRADPTLGGMRSCILGHGGQPVSRYSGVVPGSTAPALRKSWNVKRPDGKLKNGFALFTFDGAGLRVRYVDEDGDTWYQEKW
ncbi:MAG TPA: metallophosphoesterase [Longimicrobium sp.]|nr:metallophosphoesterase [Longimicrobium sp.]